MGKQRTQERIRAGEDTIGYGPVGAIPQIFEEHYRMALKYMTSEHAAANAHDAVQRHFASLREVKEGDDM